MTWVNELFSFHSWLALGSPKAMDKYEPESGWFEGECVRTRALELVSEIANFGGSGAELSKISLDGNRKLLHKQIHTFSMHDYDRQQRFNFNHKHHSNIDQLITNAIHVDPDRIGIPEEAGTVDPLKHLAPSERSVVRDLRKLKLPEDERGPIPRACHRILPGKERELVIKLLSHDMAVLVSETDLPKDAHGRLLLGGLFSVPKNETEDRLMYDRRPENATVRKLGWLRLPSGACFRKLLLGKDEYFRGSGDDLRNFYYSLKLPVNWIPQRNRVAYCP